MEAFIKTLRHKKLESVIDFPEARSELELGGHVPPRVGPSLKITVHGFAFSLYFYIHRVASKLC